MNLVKKTKQSESRVSALSPREIVSELDRYVIGVVEKKFGAKVAVEGPK